MYLYQYYYTIAYNISLWYHMYSRHTATRHTALSTASHVHARRDVMHLQTRVGGELKVCGRGAEARRV